MCGFPSGKMFSLGPGALEITDLEPLSSLLSPPSSNLQDLFQPPPHTEKQYGQETDWDKETGEQMDPPLQLPPVRARVKRTLGRENPLPRPKISLEKG